MTVRSAVVLAAEAPPGHVAAVAAHYRAAGYDVLVVLNGWTGRALPPMGDALGWPTLWLPERLADEDAVAAALSPSGQRPALIVRAEDVPPEEVA